MLANFKFFIKKYYNFIVLTCYRIKNHALYFRDLATRRLGGNNFPQKIYFAPQKQFYLIVTSEFLYYILTSKTQLA